MSEIITQLMDPALERACLGGLIIDPPLIDELDLRPDDFYIVRNAGVLRVMQEMRADGIGIDTGTLAVELARRLPPDSEPWSSHIIRCLTEQSSSLQVREYARQLRDLRLRRRMARQAQDQVERAYNLRIPPEPDPDLPSRDAPERKVAWTVAELRQATFPAPRGPWPGVIPVGLTMLGARPKHGKSLLMMQLTAALGTGGMMFGQRLEKSRVLYYTLEDQPARLKERTSRLQIPDDALIEYRTEILDLDHGGLAVIDAQAEEFGLIVIDTITRAVRGRDLTKDAAKFGDLLGQIQTTALENNMAIVVVAHTRKPSGSDPDAIDDLLGSTQMTAAADCVLAIYKQQGGSVLKGRARDMDDINLSMRFDPFTLCWQPAAPEQPPATTENQDKIIQALRVFGKMRASTVAEHIGGKRQNTATRLQRLVSLGLVRSEAICGVTFYYIPESGPDEYEGQYHEEA